MMKKTILVILFALFMVIEVVKADYIFGEPTNLGPTINSSVEDGGPCISSSGLELYFYSFLEGWANPTMRVATRETTEDPWGETLVFEAPLKSLTAPSLSADGLSLYFDSDQPGGSGGTDICVSTRKSVSDPWGAPVNLGPSVNSSALDMAASVSADGLELYFGSLRPGGSGDWDIYVTTRTNPSEPWSTAVNLGPAVNSVAYDGHPCISPDGLSLFITSTRSGGYGDWDIWMTRRVTRDDNWGIPVNLGPNFNTSAGEAEVSLSSDGRTLYFSDWWIPHTNGHGKQDLWQVSIDPVVDLNGDGIVDGADLSIIADHWGTDNSLCDIGPMPWGDGVVNVQDLIIIAEYLSPAGPEEINVNENDDGGQIELEQGQILVVTLESNPTTGYSWQQVENQLPYLEQQGQPDFISSQKGGPPIVGAGGWEVFRFKAISSGKMNLQLVYRRPWEEGVEPANTFSLNVLIN
ncbi:MAG: protease inhibitor I42 family protein [Sedimentisphaerales bacterium]|nr:protease inhibitor I42 family protein [Sedimentisphaerales bacterium]